MPVVMGHDKLRLNHQLLLSLPFREMTGQRVKDRSIPHHTIVGHNMAWASGMPVIPSQLGLGVFNGANAYCDGAAIDTADLDFTTGDYSIAGWIFYQATAMSQIVIGRYGVDLDGWELYLHDPNETLNLRHHHSSLPATRTGCYSSGWATGQWHLFGISRSGSYPRHFRNGAEVEVVGVLSDPDACNRDLVIGTRFTKDANWYSGYMTLLRVWDRMLEDWEHRQIFEMERHWFGI